MDAKQTEETFRKYAWDYFAVHAAQRMTAFQFFITLATAIVAAYVALMSAGGGKWTALIGLLLSVFSFVFFKLDSRTKELIKSAENALSHLDSLHGLPDVDSMPNPLRLIDRDRVACTQNSNVGILRRRYSYSKCFSIIFVTFGALGSIAAITSVCFFPLFDKDKKDQGHVLNFTNVTSEKRDDRKSDGGDSSVVQKSPGDIRKFDDKKRRN